MTAGSDTEQHDADRSRLMGSTNDLADDTPRSRLDHVLQWVPRILSSKPHVIALVALGVYLILLPLLGVMSELRTPRLATSVRPPAGRMQDTPPDPPPTSAA